MSAFLGYLELGNTAIRNEWCTIVRNDQWPSVTDSNHVASVRARSQKEVDAFFREIDDQLGHVAYRAFRVDPLTPPALEARLLADGYRSGTDLHLVLSGSLEETSGGADVVSRPVVTEADWEVLFTLKRADHAEAESQLIVRVSPASRDLTQLSEAFALAQVLADLVPEVTAPVPAVDGSVVLLWEGRPVSVWPYREGVFLDRHDQDQRSAAAGLLARLHRAGLAWLKDSPGSLEEGYGLVHGDFYPRNLLCSGGRIVGLIDWDDVRIERLDAELAWATWELAKSAEGDALIDDPAITFIDAYVRAGGPARPGADFVQLIRERLSGELNDDDADYVASLRAALRTLQDSRHRALLRSFA